MTSAYSTNLAIELIGTGDQAGAWGTTTNTNLGTLIEQAISGYTTQAITDGADTVLTMNPGASAVARNMVIECTGTLTAARNLVVPANKKLYFIYNNTSGGFAVTVKVSGLTGVSVPSGAKILLLCNGTDIVLATNYMLSPVLGGTPVAPTATPGTNTTQIANTAFVSAAVGALGSMASQNANNVNISGGTVAGITDIAIADGGTGASTASNARANLGLVIGSDVLAPNGSGASLTNLNASALTSGTVPVTRSGALRLMASQNVYAGTTVNATISVSLPTSLFGGNTPSFVMFTANTYATGITDLRVFYMCSGTGFVQANLVMGSASDDTDQNGVGAITTCATFVLPYAATQDFYIGLSWGGGSYYGTNINVIGYQV